MTRRRARRDGRPGDGRIEHMRMQEVIKTADWIVDLGPEGGDKGGEIVAEGTPEDVAKEPRSYTGQYLTETLAKSDRATSGSAMKFSKAHSRISKREREAAE